MTNGSNHTGDIHVGDLDMWTFSTQRPATPIDAAHRRGGGTTGASALDSIEEPDRLRTWDRFNVAGDID